MSLGKKLRDIFGDRQGAAEKRARKKILQRCAWDEVKDDVFPKKGVAPRVSAVVAAVIEAKHWSLLTPIVAEVGEWVGVIDLVYRKGEFGQPPMTRAQELEDIYQALRAAPKSQGEKVVRSFITCVENWSCQHNFEAGYDWAKTKPEFVPVPPVGLAALADHPIEGNPLAMKILATPEDIARAAEAADWVYSGNAADRDAALDNLEAWRKKLEEKNKQPPAPPSKGPVF